MPEGEEAGGWLRIGARVTYLHGLGTRFDDCLVEAVHDEDEAWKEEATPALADSDDEEERTYLALSERPKLSSTPSASNGPLRSVIEGIFTGHDRALARGRQISGVDDATRPNRPSTSLAPASSATIGHERACWAARTAVEYSRRIASFLQVHAKVENIHDNLGMHLRLTQLCIAEEELR